MNNTAVQTELANCAQELAHIQGLVAAQSITSQLVPYLTKYAVVRACGAIEIAFKGVIADFCSYRGKAQVKHFINRRVRDGSANPSMHMIHKFLGDFDPNWTPAFKALLQQEANRQQLQTSLQSLVDARNDFAHGGNPTVTIHDVVIYYQHSVRIIELLDTVVQ